MEKPKVFQNNGNKKFTNNNDVFYSKNNNDVSTKNIYQKINDIFSSPNYIYKANVTIKLSDEQEIKCKYQLIRVEKGDNGIYTISGRFISLSNIDKMTLVQFCMKKDMENSNK